MELLRWLSNFARFEHQKNLMMMNTTKTNFINPNKSMNLAKILFHFLYLNIKATKINRTKHKTRRQTLKKPLCDVESNNQLVKAYSKNNKSSIDNSETDSCCEESTECQELRNPEQINIILNGEDEQDICFLYHKSNIINDSVNSESNDVFWTNKQTQHPFKKRVKANKERHETLVEVAIKRVKLEPLDTAKNIDQTCEQIKNVSSDIECDSSNALCKTSATSTYELKKCSKRKFIDDNKSAAKKNIQPKQDSEKSCALSQQSFYPLTFNVHNWTGGTVEKKSQVNFLTYADGITRDLLVVPVKLSWNEAINEYYKKRISEMEEDDNSFVGPIFYELLESTHFSSARDKEIKTIYAQKMNLTTNNSKPECSKITVSLKSNNMIRKINNMRSRKVLTKKKECIAKKIDKILADINKTNNVTSLNKCYDKAINVLFFDSGFASCMSPYTNVLMEVMPELFFYLQRKTVEVHVNLADFKMIILEEILQMQNLVNTVLDNIDDKNFNPKSSLYKDIKVLRYRILTKLKLTAFDKMECGLLELILNYDYVCDTYCLQSTYSLEALYITVFTFKPNLTIQNKILDTLGESGIIKPIEKHISRFIFDLFNHKESSSDIFLTFVLIINYFEEINGRNPNELVIDMILPYKHQHALIYADSVSSAKIARVLSTPKLLVILVQKVKSLFVKNKFILKE